MDEGLGFLAKVGDRLEDQLIDGNKMTKCLDCGREKLISEFHKSPTNRDGRRNRCNQCEAVLSRARVARRFGEITYRQKRSTPKATRSPTIRDLEWAAGFLEGEGCFRVGYTHSHQSRSETVTVTQVNIVPLLKLQEIFGGTVYDRGSQPKRRHQYGWYVTGARARGVMMTLYVLFTPVRRRQIRVALGVAI